MFERIKCYRNLKKDEEFLRGMEFLSEMSGDKKLEFETMIALHNLEILKHKIWFHRNVAVEYNKNHAKIVFN